MIPWYLPFNLDMGFGGGPGVGLNSSAPSLAPETTLALRENSASSGYIFPNPGMMTDPL